MVAVEEDPVSLHFGLQCSGTKDRRQELIHELASTTWLLCSQGSLAEGWLVNVAIFVRHAVASSSYYLRRVLVVVWQAVGLPFVYQEGLSTDES